MIKRISVFCGSGSGSDPAYTAAAIKLGAVLVKKRIGLVYGGGKIGLMGVIAGSILKNGGNVTGVIPRALVNKKVAYTTLDDLHIVDTMHERKALIADFSDAFIAMPGGFGTLDEIFEAITWAQLGIHEKPCGFLNVNGYFDQLFRFINHAVAQEFIHEQNRSLILVDDDPEKLLQKVEAYKPLRIDKARWALGTQE